MDCIGVVIEDDGDIADVADNERSVCGDSALIRYGDCGIEADFMVEGGGGGKETKEEKADLSGEKW